MHNTIANVFKIIIITIILGVLYTLSLMVIDLFATTQRMQEVGDYLSRDIATHNCLLYQPYKYAADELVEISNNSEYLRTFENDYCPEIGSTVKKCPEDANSELDEKRGITLTTYTRAAADVDAHMDQSYIQMSETAMSWVISAAAGDTLLTTHVKDNQLSNTGACYAVAQYGDVLVLRINALFEPKMLARKGSNDGNITVADMQRGVWARVPVSFTYQIPCLSYIK